MRKCDAKVAGKGTGLGLSICYGLIEGHCGRVYATRKLGKGATFIPEMPIVSEKKPGWTIGGKI